MRAGLGEAGQRCAVFAVPGGRVGHIDVRRGHVQRNRVGLAVVCADVVLDRIDDAVLLRLQELHDLGTLHGGIVLLLDPVPDGVRANFAEAGLVGAVFAALGGGIAHLRVRGGDVQLNGVRLAVGIAAVAPGAVLDDARIDCHGACAIRGCIAHLFQQEPDDIVAGIGEHGQRFAYYAALLGIGHVNALGEHVQRNRVRLAVVVAGVVLHGVEDRARLRDGYSGGVHDGLVALLLQLEPDGVRAYVGKAGHVGAVFAALGGGEGRGNALGDDVQRDGVGFAVVVAGVVLHAVLDLAQLHDGHGGEVHDGFITRLLQLEPDGVLAGVGEAGLVGGVCTVLGGGEGRSHALGGHADGDGVCLSVIVAVVAVDAVLDLLQALDDAVGVGQPREAVHAVGVDLHAVAAGVAGSACELHAVRVVVGEAPLAPGDARAAGREIHRAAGEGVAVLLVEGHLVAHIGLGDRHAGGALHGLAAVLLQAVVHHILARAEEAGLRRTVRPAGGKGVAHRHALRVDVQRDRVLLAIVHAAVIPGAVLDGFLGKFLLEDGEAMEDGRGMVGAVADDFDAVAARRTGRRGQRAIGVRVADLPGFNAFVEGRKAHSFSGVREAARELGPNRVTDVGPLDVDGLNAFFADFITLLDPVGNFICTCVDECGVCTSVIPAVGGIGVGHG